MKESRKRNEAQLTVERFKPGSFVTQVEDVFTTALSKCWLPRMLDELWSKNIQEHSAHSVLVFSITSLRKKIKAF